MAKKVDKSSFVVLEGAVIDTMQELVTCNNWDIVLADLKKAKTFIILMEQEAERLKEKHGVNSYNSSFEG